MENKKTETDFINVGKEVHGSLSKLMGLAEDALNGAVDSAAPEEREKVKQEVEKLKNGEFKDASGKMGDLLNTLNNYGR